MAYRSGDQVRRACQHRVRCDVQPKRMRKLLRLQRPDVARQPRRGLLGERAEQSSARLRAPMRADGVHLALGLGRACARWQHPRVSPPASLIALVLLLGLGGCGSSALSPYAEFGDDDSYVTARTRDAGAPRAPGPVSSVSPVSWAT